MNLNGLDYSTIKKLGQWSGKTCMMYIHNQIGCSICRRVIANDSTCPTFLQCWSIRTKNKSAHQEDVGRKWKAMGPRVRLQEKDLCVDDGQ
eukprot:5875503-Ditylum_brightwellii.AAC.2